MGEHITIELDADALARARTAARAQGIAMEDCLKKLITAHLPNKVPENRQKALLARIIGIGSSEYPTDIAKDKDKLIGEAARQEHLEETRQK